MADTGVEQVEKDLGYTPDDAKIIKGVRLIWQELEKLRKQAKRDPKHLGPYRDLLRSSISQARAQQPAEDPEKASVSFWKWYDEQYRMMEIEQAEVNRGSHHMAWCEKWLPVEYAAFEKAISLVVDNPTGQHFESAKVAASKLLRAYVGAIEGNQRSRNR